MRSKDAHSFTLNVSSSSTWTSQDLYKNRVDDVSEDLPNQVLVFNKGTIDVYAKVMSKDEGDADARGGVVVPAGASILFEVEEREEPFYRVSCKLISGSTATTVYANCLRYENKKI